MIETVFFILGVLFLIFIFIGIALYAKPFINNIGQIVLSDDEKVELHHALNDAKEDSLILLQRLEQAGLIDDEIKSLIKNKTNSVLNSEDRQVPEQNNLRHLFTKTLRIEIKELEQLKKIGLISFYTYYDIKNTLRSARDNWLNSSDKLFVDEDTKQATFFKTVEATVIRFLREKNWASTLLSKYQYSRLSARLRRNIAGVLMSHTVLNQLNDLADDYDEELIKKVKKVYENRYMRRKHRIEDILAEYPEFYLRFETRLLAEISLTCVKNNVNAAFQEGAMSSKVSSLIEKRVIDAINDLPKVQQPVTTLTVNNLIGKVPLLNGISAPIIEKLSNKVTVLHFLKDDVVIGEGEHGDALYIIHKGQINVYKDDSSHAIAELYTGNFMGEKALLGESIRTATAIATMPSTLLRLSRKQVLELAEEEPELRRRLEEVSNTRA